MVSVHTNSAVCYNLATFRLLARAVYSSNWVITQLLYTQTYYAKT